MLFSRWTWGRTARLCRDALRAGGPARGRVAVIDRPPLARALAAEGFEVFALLRSGVTMRRWPWPAARVGFSALPIGDGVLDGVVGAGAGEDQDHRLHEWARTVRNGGVVVLVEQGPPEESTRWLLCAGLLDLEQRVLGRTVVTSGRVARELQAHDG